ncbi:Sucrose-6-phosphate hydrolase [compost metagenome]
MKEFFYRPSEAWVGDVIPYFAEGEFKLYYLHGWRGNYKEGMKNGWYLLGTHDFVDYREYGPTGIEGGTGHVLEIGGLYHMFYCIFPEGKQLICHATSRDLMNWEKIPEHTFGADDEIYELSDWRDPFVFWNEEKREYWMLIAARTKGPTNRRGCIALCTSKDLEQWETQEPFYAPSIHVGAHECPDLFKIGEWWYLVYSSYTDRFATFYRMSRSLEGPWITPPVDTFDGRAYYAAKSASDGQRRYLFGWNPTKTDNLFGWNPPSAQGHDYHTWDWGGNLIVHEIIQKPDGTLGVTVPETVESVFARPHESSFTANLGNWEISEEKLEISTPQGFSAALGPDLPGQCKLEMYVTFDTDTHNCGVILRADSDLDNAYYIKLEPHRNRIVFSSAIMQSEEGGKTFPYEVELERPVRLESGIPYRIRVILDGTIGEVYINDEVALSFRMYDIPAGRVGVFATQGSTVFEQFSVHSL